MSSDLYSFGTTFQTHSSSELVSSDIIDGDLQFFSESFPFFTTDETQENSSSNSFSHTCFSLDPFSSSFFSFSPPSTHLQSLSLYQTTSNSVQNNTINSANEFGSFLDGSEFKSEECQLDVDNYVYNNNQQFLPHSYGGYESVSKYIQRSFSSNCFEGKPGFLLQPHSATENLTDSPIFQGNEISSPENNSFFSRQMRRVCSTGDLQSMKGNYMSPTEGQQLEESNFKVGRYSAEERKERISKYRAKRTQRNFNKTIKYACRKTLADNRPRIRGRFARNDEAIEIPKAPCSTRDEDEADFWIEELRLHEEQEDGTEQYLKTYGANQFRYCAGH